MSGGGLTAEVGYRNTNADALKAIFPWEVTQPPMHSVLFAI